MPPAKLKGYPKVYSVGRWRGGAAVRREHGGQGTLTEFSIQLAPDTEPRKFVGRGPTPGHRRTDAIRQAREAAGLPALPLRPRKPRQPGPSVAALQAPERAEARRRSASRVREVDADHALALDHEGAAWHLLADGGDLVLVADDGEQVERYPGPESATDELLRRFGPAVVDAARVRRFFNAHEAGNPRGWIKRAAEDRARQRDRDRERDDLLRRIVDALAAGPKNESVLGWTLKADTRDVMDAIRLGLGRSVLRYAPTFSAGGGDQFERNDQPWGPGPRGHYPSGPQPPPRSAPEVQGSDAPAEARAARQKPATRKKSAKRKKPSKRKRPAKRKKPATRKPKPRPRCAGSVRAVVERAEKLKARYDNLVAERAARLTTRQANQRDGLLARQAEREKHLAALVTGPKSPGARRLAEAEKRHGSRLRALEAKHKAALAALPRAVECEILGGARARRAVVRGCADLCGLNVAGGVGGDATTIALPSARGTPRVLPARFVLVDAETLRPSHDPISFEPRADYPDETQERRYEDDPAEKYKVDMIGQNMIPGLVQNTNSGAVDGTSIITIDKIVLSGNGRAMGVIRHYRRGRTVLSDFLRKQIQIFGIDPRALARVKNPVVVRVVDVPAADRARLVRDFNTGLTQQMSAADEAAALARQLPPDLPAMLRAGGADEGLGPYLASKASAPLVGALERSGFINRANRARLISDDGLLTHEARDDVARMLVAAVLPLDLAERSPELARAAERSAAAWLVAAGAGTGWDVRPALAAAGRDYLALRASGACLSRWREQGSMEPRQATGPMASTMLEILDLAASRPVVFSKIAAAYAAASRAGGLFGQADPVDALRQAAADNHVDTASANSRRRCARKAA